MTTDYDNWLSLTATRLACTSSSAFRTKIMVMPLRLRSWRNKLRVQAMSPLTNWVFRTNIISTITKPRRTGRQMLQSWFLVSELEPAPTCHVLIILPSSSAEFWLERSSEERETDGRPIQQKIWLSLRILERTAFRGSFHEVETILQVLSFGAFAYLSISLQPHERVDRFWCQVWTHSQGTLVSTWLDWRKQGNWESAQDGRK